MNKTVTFKLTTDEIEASLSKMIGSPHCKLLSSIIINNLEKTDRGLHQIVKAFAGVQEVSKYKVLDTLMVPWEDLSTWKMNEDAMIKDGLIIKGHVECVIFKIDPFKNENLYVRYHIIRGPDTASEEATSELNGHESKYVIVKSNFIE